MKVYNLYQVFVAKTSAHNRHSPGSHRDRHMSGVHQKPILHKKLGRVSVLAVEGSIRWVLGSFQFPLTPKVSSSTKHSS